MAEYRGARGRFAPGGRDSAAGHGRLSRRQFCRQGALAVAGVTVGGIEALSPGSARAQGSGPPSVMPGSLRRLGDPLALQLLDPGSTLLYCQHRYRFDVSGVLNPFISLASSPSALTTYRLGFNRQALGPVVDVLTPGLRSFGIVADVEESVGEILDPPPPGQWLLLSVYRRAQPIGTAQYRVYDNCSFYCLEGDRVVVTLNGSDPITYEVPPPVPDVGAGPVTVERPNLPGNWDRGEARDVTSTEEIDYFEHDNVMRGATSSAIWKVTLRVANGEPTRVHAFIPGTDKPQNRTAHATYEITSAEAKPRSVMISQQTATSQWVLLGTFPFSHGQYRVVLGNDTGEEEGTTRVVASAMRWGG